MQTESGIKIQLTSSEHRDEDDSAWPEIGRLGEIRLRQDFRCNVRQSSTLLVKEPLFTLQSANGKCRKLLIDFDWALMIHSNTKNHFWSWKIPFLKVPKQYLNTVAIPKSEILILSRSSRRMFSGLRSRCATPRECKYSTPARIWLK